MPFHPEPRAVPHLWRWSRALPAGRAQRRARPGRPRWRAPGHRAGQPGPARRALRHPDPVGGDPVPGAARERPGAPPHPVGVPVRRRGRGRLDRRGRRPGGDAPGRPAAHAGLALPRAPERLRHARWPGSTASTSRWCPAPTRASSSSAPTSVRDTATPDRSPLRAALGPPGADARSRAPDRGRSSPLHGLPLGAHRRRAGRPAGAGGRGAPGRRRARATPPSGSPTPPPAATR